MQTPNTFKWGVFFAQVARAVEEARDNTPPPAVPPMSDAQIADAIEAAVPKAAAALAIVNARPGLVTAAGTIFGALPWSWAAPARELAYGLPGLLTAAVKYGPIAAGLIREFAPAATGIAGDDPADSRGR